MKSTVFVKRMLASANKSGPFLTLPGHFSPERYMLNDKGFIVERADYWLVLPPASPRVLKGIKGVASWKRAKYGVR